MPIMRRRLVTLVACGVLLPQAVAAEPSGRFTLVQLDLPGRVTRVMTGDDGAITVTGDGARYAIRAAQAGAVALPYQAGDGVPTSSRADLLPHSIVTRGGNDILEAWLALPTDRYRHGVLGDGLEAAALRVRRRDGAVAELAAGKDAVFEDLVPRLADLDGDGRDEVIVVKSYRDRGAALAVAGLDAGGRLVVLAETPPIGRPNRWLNPIGAADFDGDGAVEIAYVETPHIGGRLMLWQWHDGALAHEAAEPGFSNHAIGSTELGLAAVADLDRDGVPDLAVPGRHRDRLRLVSFAGGIFRDLADIPAGGTIATAIAPLDRETLVYGLGDGRLMAATYAP